MEGFCLRKLKVEFLFIIILSAILTSFLGCSTTSSDMNLASKTKFVPPPPDYLTIYVEGKRIDLKKNDPRFKNLSEEITRLTRNITDGVGGNRTWRPAGFENQMDSIALKDTVIILAQWEKKHKVSLKQKEMTLGEQGWEGSPRDQEGNFVIETDGFMVEIYEKNLDAHLGYKHWLTKEKYYWAGATANNLDAETLLKIIEKNKHD
ncbi:hypothetical protein Tfer_1281 [Thermincola ferriacetica]|uniref:Uncharacterized protein n=1 Tax=Thermincola ferriacetica TaxID=281456 RepID=A0A0L6W438_9FIRM|nr:hypothetical protein Tfer_1281 [Thermincola ferriacetica]